MRNFKQLFLIGLVANNLLCGDAAANNAQWMTQYAKYIQNKRLRDIFIPGTHDSATYVLANSFGKGQDYPHRLNMLKYIGVGFVVMRIAKRWGKAQDRTIYQQLEDGIRFLDLRVIYRDDKKAFYTVHGLFGPSLQNVLNQINQFALEHPKEIIIIQVGDLRYLLKNKKNHEAALISKLIRAFGEKLIPKELGTNVLIKRLWKLRKQIVLIYDRSDIVRGNPLIWEKDRYLESYWGNEETPQKLKPKLDAHLKRRETAYQDKLYVVQSQLTPSGQMIKKSLNAFSKSPKSLKALANQIKPLFPSWLKSWEDKNPNIIMTDFADGQIAKEIFQLNNPENRKP